MIRKTTSLLLVAVFSFSALLTACSGSNEAAKPMGKEEKGVEKGTAKPVTLKLWYRQGSAYRKLLDEAKAEFAKLQPNIQLEINDVPPAQYTAAFQAAIAANELPDLFQNPSIPLKQLVELNQLHELDDLITSAKRAEFVDGTWTEGQSLMNGKVYGIPHHDGRGHTSVLYYNKDLLKEAGYTDNLPKQISWEKFEEIAKKVVQKKPGTHAINLSGTASWILNTNLSSMVSAISPELSGSYASDITWNYKQGVMELNSPALIESMKFFKRLNDEKLLNPNWLLMNFTESRQEFMDGKVAFNMQVSEAVGVFPKDKSNFGVTNIPTKDGKPFYSPFAGEVNVNWEVAKDTKHYEEVKTFLNFFMDYYYKQSRKLGIIDSPSIKINDVVKSDFELFNQTSELKNAVTVRVPNPVNKNKNTIDVMTEFAAKKPTVGWANIFQGYMTGQIADPKVELDRVNEEWNKVLTNAINTVNKDGKAVSREDFTFKDWTPFQPYTK